MTDLKLVIGSPDYGLSVSIKHRTHPDGSYDWDGNWLSVTAELKLPCFRGCVDADLRAEELANFNDQIRQLYNTFDGYAEFDTMEKWVGIRMEISKTGRIGCRGFLIDEQRIGDQLTFQLELDQSYLPKLLHEIDSVLSAFPVIGGRNT